jgi:hypothetical protein
MGNRGSSVRRGVTSAVLLVVILVPTQLPIAARVATTLAARGVISLVCAPVPEISCRGPNAQHASSRVAVKDKTPDARDVVLWKWVKGDLNMKSDFGSPTTTTDYLLCIYDEGRGLVSSAQIPADDLCAGKPCWKELDSGFKYKDKDGTPDGITALALKAGPTITDARIVLKGKGENLDTPTLPMLQPVTVQLRNSAGICWQAVYSPPAQKNDPTQFKDKTD